MNTSTHGMTGRWVRHGGLPLFAAMALLIVISGCNDDTDEGVLGSGATGALGVETVMTPPDAGELFEGLDLTDGERATLEAALAEWRSQAAAQRGSDSGRGHGFGGGRGCGPGGFGHGTDDGEDREAPMLGFIVSASDVLDSDQLTLVIGRIAERRQTHMQEMAARMDEMRERMRERFGDHGPRGGHMGGGHCEELDLSDEQATAMRDARVEMHESMRDLRDALRNGEITEDEFDARRTVLREAHDARIQEILDDEQYARLLELRRQRAVEMAERRLENLDERTGDRLELLVRVLGLDDAQRATIEGIIADATARARTLLEGVIDGSIDPNDARAEGRTIRDEAHDAIRAALTEEQLAVFDALKGLRPRGGRFRG